MMSLLILNQKVLYLILLITLLYGLTSANQNITIYVQPNGTDQSECMEGNESIPCNTLSYVLNQINNGNNDIFNGTNISVYVYITYYQEMTNLSHIQLLVNLYLIGVDNPVLDFSGSHYNFSGNLSALIHHQGGSSFYAENITFYQFFISFNYFVTVSFNKCIFTNGGRALTDKEVLDIVDIYNLIISNCLFHYNDVGYELIVVQNVLNVEISGCEFYQNKGQDFFIWIGKAITDKEVLNTVDIHNLTISNCLFHNNETQFKALLLVYIVSVSVSVSCLFIWTWITAVFMTMIYIYTVFQFESSNSESMINITNCLFSNNTSVDGILIIAIDRLYMSNVNLISNKMKRIETSIMLITSVHPNGEQHLNISNINFINNTATGLELKYVTMYFNNITFYNNTGLYGGGMSLYQTSIYLGGPLRFENNKADFGGAIYIAVIEGFAFDRYCITLEQITFSSNFAVTLGDDVFIEDGFSVSYEIYFTFPCIDEKTNTNNVIGDHIISGPHNITINQQSNSTITLFPGQKLTYSADVTDYFGNLTSCSIQNRLQCGVHFIFCKYVVIQQHFFQLVISQLMYI